MMIEWAVGYIAVAFIVVGFAMKVEEDNPIIWFVIGLFWPIVLLVSVGHRIASNIYDE